MEKVSKLTEILLRLNNDHQAVKLVPKERMFLAEADFMEVALAQLNVLAAGVAAFELWRMWSQNRKILPDQCAKLKAELPANHVLQKVLAEHEMILCFISDLEETNDDIQALTSASSFTQECRRLAHIAGHLMAAEQHREREEEVIYPQLRQFGYADMLDIIGKQHWEISRYNYRLKGLAWKIDEMDFDEFKRNLSQIVNRLVPAMRMHVFMEDNILFPLALEVIKDKQAWTRMKQACDQIGYCGYDGK